MRTVIFSDRAALCGTKRPIAAPGGGCPWGGCAGGGGPRGGLGGGGGGGGLAGARGGGPARGRGGGGGGGGPRGGVGVPVRRGASGRVHAVLAGGRSATERSEKASRDKRGAGGFRQGFGDMEAAGISALTGLPVEEVPLAKMREFDEPFVFPRGPDSPISSRPSRRKGSAGHGGAFFTSWERATRAERCEF